MNRKIQNKIAKYAIISTLILYFMFLISLFYGDIMQYKRIGTTNYYLVENSFSGNGTILCYREKDTDDVFYNIIYPSSNIDIFWNDDYILLKDKGDSTSFRLHKPCYYIISQKGSGISSQPWRIQEMKSIDDYHRFIRNIGLDEKKLLHTDGYIPWGLHLFD